MAKKNNESVNEKTPVENVETAPMEDKPVEQEVESVEETNPEETIDEALTILNIIDQEIGGKGEITEIPEGVRGSIKYIVDKLIFLRDMFDDPMWKAILDDMADQKEDGKTPSVEVAVVRNIPLEKIQAIAESEDYEGAQQELSSNLEAGKQAEMEEAEYESSFEESRKAGEEYAASMGYSEDEKNELFQMVLDLLKITADGKITVKEFEQVDKMRNYDSDIAAMKSQVESTEAKEVLPDKASVDATVKSGPQTPNQAPKANTPGMGSMAAYDNAATDITQVGKRKRM